MWSITLLADMASIWPPTCGSTERNESFHYHDVTCSTRTTYRPSLANGYEAAPRKCCQCIMLYASSHIWWTARSRWKEHRWRETVARTFVMVQNGATSMFNSHRYQIPQATSTFCSSTRDRLVRVVAPTNLHEHMLFPRHGLTREGGCYLSYDTAPVCQYGMYSRCGYCFISTSIDN
jgi:hypothetical protein